MNQALRSLIVLMVCLMFVGITQTLLWMVDTKIENTQNLNQELRIQISDLQKEYENYVNVNYVLEEAMNRETLHMIKLPEDRQGEVLTIELPE
ncbi:MAG: hypothetical protein PHI40_00810 [Caldisericia bacterium]|nr:hypothetical protein [Caldisericia bacterium]MDD4613935.1 hypothetical protein [Caldisericia bacterium]